MSATTNAKRVYIRQKCVFDSFHLVVLVDTFFGRMQAGLHRTVATAGDSPQRIARSAGNLADFVAPFFAANAVGITSKPNTGVRIPPFLRECRSEAEHWWAQALHVDTLVAALLSDAGDDECGTGLHGQCF